MLTAKNAAPAATARDGRPQPVVAEMRIDADDHRLSRLPFLIRDELMSARRRGSRLVHRCRAAGRGRSHPAPDLLAGQVQRRQHLVRRRGDPQLGQRRAEHARGMSRGIGREDDPDPGRAGRRPGDGARHEPRPFPDRPIQVEGEAPKLRAASSEIERDWPWLIDGRLLPSLSGFPIAPSPREESTDLRSALPTSPADGAFRSRHGSTAPSSQAARPCARIRAIAELRFAEEGLGIHAAARSSAHRGFESIRRGL